MAGFLGLDLDIAEMRLVELQQSAGGYQLHAALALTTGATDAATLGAQLKAKLSEVGFKANSVVIALAHDSMSLREVRHPDIPAGELPAIVQFQVLKESAMPADDAIVDYIPLAQKFSTGERRSLTFTVRKARMQFCEKMCEAAGLKLLAVVPRAVALFAAIAKTKSETGGQAIGYACSNSFFVIHNGELIFNRSLGTGNDADELISELRRSIAGYENQANMPPLAHVCVAGHELPPEAQEQLSSFRIPIRVYDPYLGVTGADRLIGHGDYAVACGAAQTTKVYKKPPVEFLQPKKVVIKPNNTRRYAIIAGVGLAALLLLTYGFYWMLTSSADEEIAAFQDRLKDKHALEKTYIDGEVEKRYEAVKTWKDHEIFVLEEIYDLMETFPDIAGVQIIKSEWKSIAPPVAPPSVIASPTTKTTTTTPAVPKSTPIKPVALLTLKAQAEQESQLKVLEQALKNSKHWKWQKSDPVPQEREKNTVVYELQVYPLKPEDYRAVITVGSNVTSTDGSSTNRPGARRTVRPAGGSRP